MSRWLAATFSGYCNDYLLRSPGSIVLPASIGSCHCVSVFAWMKRHCDNKSAFPTLKFRTIEELIKLRDAAVRLDIPLLVEKVDRRIRQRRDLVTFQASVPADVDMSMEVFPARIAPTPDRRTQDNLHSNRDPPSVSSLEMSLRVLFCLILGWDMSQHNQAEAAELDADDDESTPRMAFVDWRFVGDNVDRNCYQ